MVGVDIAQDMLSIFDHKREIKGPKNARGYLVNIFNDIEVEQSQSSVSDSEGGGSGLDNFDAAVASLAYHHIDDIDEASAALFKRLKPQAWALVADLAKDIKPENIPKGSFNTEIVPHPTGFTPGELEATLKKAGFVQVQCTSYTVELWVNDMYLDRFGKHHVVSRDDDSDIKIEKEWGERTGIRYYDTKQVNGETRYLIRKKLHFAGGQHP